MEKMDKAFAGLILLALCAFWVIISPAAISSRISEAAPTEVTPPVQPQVQANTKNRAKTPRSTNRGGRSDPQLSAAQLKRLKRRDKDTPKIYYHENRDDTPANIPTTDRRNAKSDDSEPSSPVYY